MPDTPPPPPPAPAPAPHAAGVSALVSRVVSQLTYTLIVNHADSLAAAFGLERATMGDMLRRAAGEFTTV